MFCGRIQIILTLANFSFKIQRSHLKWKSGYSESRSRLKTMPLQVNCLKEEIDFMNEIGIELRTY